MQDVLLDVAIEEAGYEPGNPKVEQILFQIRSGGLTGLIGPNGAGKSTTIRSLAAGSMAPVFFSTGFRRMRKPRS